MTNYERQSDIPINTPETIAVVGCGGAGSWTALFSAMQGVKKIQLYDDDVIEGHNLNRMPYTKNQIGEQKTEALKDLISRYREEAVVYSYSRLEADSLSLREVKKADVIYCATDTMDSQKMLQEFAEQHNISFHKLGYDGLHMTLSQSVNSWGNVDPEEGYEITPSWLIPPVIVAAMAVGAEATQFDYRTISEDLPNILEQLGS